MYDGHNRPWGDFPILSLLSNTLRRLCWFQLHEEFPRKLRAYAYVRSNRTCDTHLDLSYIWVVVRGLSMALGSTLCHIAVRSHHVEGVM